MQPIPPDERIDAPPHALQWSERIRPNGGAVTFRGPRPPTHPGAWLVVVAALTLLSGSTVFGGRQLKPTVELIGGLVLVGALFWKWRTAAVSAAVVDVDSMRLRIDPVGLLARTREVPLAAIDYFAAQTEIEGGTSTNLNGRSTRIELYRWYPIFLYLGSGERFVVTAFGDRDCALFVAQRLDMLAQRAKAVAGMPRVDRTIVPKPYR